MKLHILANLIVVVHAGKVSPALVPSDLDEALRETERLHDRLH